MGGRVVLAPKIRGLRKVKQTKRHPERWCFHKWKNSKHSISPYKGQVKNPEAFVSSGRT